MNISPSPLTDTGKALLRLNLIAIALLWLYPLLTYSQLPVRPDEQGNWRIIYKFNRVKAKDLLT